MATVTPTLRTTKRKALSTPVKRTVGTVAKRPSNYVAPTATRNTGTSAPARKTTSLSLPGATGMPLNTGAFNLGTSSSQIGQTGANTGSQFKMEDWMATQQRIREESLAAQGIEPKKPFEMSIEDEALANIRIDEKEKDKLGIEFFGDKYDQPTSLEGYLERLQKDQDASKAYTEDQMATAKRLEEMDYNEMVKQAEAAKSSMTESLSQGREAPMSTTAPMATEKYIGTVNEQIDKATMRLDSAEKSRQESLRQLEIAQQQGREGAVEFYQEKVAMAQDDIRRAELEILQAQEQANQTSLDIMEQGRLNLESFQGIIDTGAQFDMNGLMSMADAYGIPMELAYNYYNSTEAIRQDKNLDMAEKQMKLQESAFDLDQKMRGITSAEIQKVDYLENLYRSGASQEEISRAKQVMGIDDIYDPMYQADVALKLAEANIKEFEANNLGTMTPKEQLEYDKLKIERDIKQMELDGAAPGVSTWKVDTMETRSTTGGASNGYKRIDPTPYFSGYDLGEAERGSTVKDSTGAAVGRVTSPYGADHSHISGEKSHNGVDIVFNNNQVVALQSGTVVKKGESPKTYGGYVWVSDDAGNVMQYGHVNVDQLENIEVGGYINEGDILIDAETDSSKWGSSSGSHTDIRYVGQAEEEAKPKPVDEMNFTDYTEINEYFNSGGKTFPYYAKTDAQKKAFKDMAEELKTVQANNETPIGDVLRYSTGNKELTQSFQEKLIQFADITWRLDGLQDALKDIDESKIGPLVGQISSRNPYETNVQAINAMITGLTPGLARGVFGEVGVLTDADMARYAKVLPNVKNTQELNMVLADMIKAQMVRSVEAQLRSLAGSYDISDQTDILSQIADIEDTADIDVAAKDVGKPSDFILSYSAFDLAEKMQERLDLKQINSLWENTGDYQPGELTNYQTLYNS